MLISQLLQICFMRRKYTLILRIQTLNIMVNNIDIKRLWIQLKTIMLLIRSSQMLVHYQVIAIQLIYLYFDLTMRKTRMSII